MYQRVHNGLGCVLGTFCASLHPDCRIICLCLCLHVTMNLVTHCAPLLAATRHGASLVQPQVTLNCVHSSVGDEVYHCTPLHAPECTDRPGLSYTRDQLLCFQAAPLGPSLTSHLTELGIRDRFPRKSSSRGGRRKQRRITVVCCGAARELVAKRRLEVVSCDPCPASPLPSPPPSQTPAASFFPGATLPSYMPPPPSSRRPLHRAGFLVRRCSPTDLHPLRRPLHRAGFLVRRCSPTDLHPLRRPLHRAGFLVRRSSPTDLHPLRRPLHHAGFLVRHCRPTDTPHLRRPLHRARLQV